jgi:hypothetical protein
VLPSDQQCHQVRRSDIPPWTLVQHRYILAGLSRITYVVSSINLEVFRMDGDHVCRSPHQDANHVSYVPSLVHQPGWIDGKHSGVRSRTGPTYDHTHGMCYCLVIVKIECCRTVLSPTRSRSSGPGYLVMAVSLQIEYMPSQAPVLVCHPCVETTGSVSASDPTTCFLHNPSALFCRSFPAS